jgi:hypothetical protein
LGLGFSAGFNTILGVPDSETAAVEACRRTHARERLRYRSWRIAVTATSLLLVGIYLYLAIGLRVEDLFYLLLNVFAVVTGFSGVIVYRAYELPAILAELPRASARERAILLAALAPMRAELLATTLPSLRLAGSREEAAALDDDELVRRLAGLERPNWPRIARGYLLGWTIVALGLGAAILNYRPDYGISLLERAQGKQAPIDRSWKPNH